MLNSVLMAFYSCLLFLSLDSPWIPCLYILHYPNPILSMPPLPPVPLEPENLTGSVRYQSQPLMPEVAGSAE